MSTTSESFKIIWRCDEYEAFASGLSCKTDWPEFTEVLSGHQGHTLAAIESELCPLLEESDLKHI